MISNSLYIHIPFCNHRCGYCDFNSYAGIQRLIPAYSQSVCKEIVYLSQSFSEQMSIKTIYFGGGTPSLLHESDLEIIINTIRNNFALVPSPEITLEANPGTVSPNYFKNIYAMGMNRVSIGMQSADQNELVLLERKHSYTDVLNAVEWSRIAGIDNVNLDLIFGLPFQELNSWMVTLNSAISLQPEHLSLYALTIEHNTPMQHKIKTGNLPEPDPDVAADMYEAATHRLAEEGYIQYEISNWARLKNSNELYSCRHNLQYWRNKPYFGVGAGAHGFINHFRTINTPTPSAYIRKMNNVSAVLINRNNVPRTPATIQIDSIEAETEIGETMMMGLRLVIEGVSSQEFQDRFGVGLNDRFGIQIERLVGLGLLEWVGEQKERLRLTQKGYLLGNQVFREFI